jgi:hypothetical protein
MVFRRAKHAAQLCTLTLALSTSACASIEVTIDFDTSTEFSSLCSYAWAEVDDPSEEQPVVDDNQLLDDRVRRAVFEQLESKGLYQAAGGTPDLTVHYHAVLERHTRVLHHRSFDEEGGVTLATSEQTEVFTITEGTLLVDIHEASSDRLIWRGVASDLSRDFVAGSDRLSAAVDEAVGKMFETYPRASATCRQRPGADEG